LVTRPLYWRSLWHYRGSSLAVVLGVVAGCSVLTGALIVGDSMRASLRGLALSRLGTATELIGGSSYFRAELADAVRSALPDRVVTGLIQLAGAASQPETQRRVNQINILGIDEAFGDLDLAAGLNATGEFAGRTTIVTDALASELGVTVGDELILRFDSPDQVSRETLMGRRDRQPISIRVRVVGITPADGIGGLSTSPRQIRPRSALLPLATLQRALDQAKRINAIVIGGADDGHARPAVDGALPAISASARLADLGLRLRPTALANTISLESQSILIPQATEQALAREASAAGYETCRVISYLANAIALLDQSGRPTSSIPYSTVAAIAPDSPFWSQAPNDQPATAVATGQIIISDWTAEALGAATGDRVRLTYYVTGQFGELAERSAEFTIAAIVPVSAVDPTLTPDYPGVTDTDRIADWDPPFPVDLDRITDRDEAYWDEYKATPKALVSLEDGIRLWSESDERLGRFTSIRIRPASGDSQLDPKQLERQLIEWIPLQQAGYAIQPLRETALAASKGSTDFGGLFIGFSFFLIASAAMLVALLFRLGVERRMPEIGVLLAMGMTPRWVFRQLLAEGAIIAGAGGLVGLASASGYAWLMLAGLRTWWADAANAPFLELHLSGGSYAIGLAVSLLVALASIVWSLRGIVRHSPQSLMVGRAGMDPVGAPRPARIAFGVAVVAFVLGVATLCLAAVSDTVPLAGGFFGGAGLLLVSGLAATRVMLRGWAGRALTTGRRGVAVGLGRRNLSRQAGRGLLTVGLIASAAFLVVSLAAFRLDAGGHANDRSSGTGGYSLYAEASSPLIYDLNTPRGREELGVSPEELRPWADADITPYRLRPGDRSSCLNLYLPAQPRLLGVSDSAIGRGGFAFSAVLAATPEQRENPWQRLQEAQHDGAIPVIGDEAAVMWQWHSGLGKTIEITDGAGRPATLRFVALLKNSVLQDELLVAESAFKRMFPTIDGYGFFLIAAPDADRDTVAAGLERSLANYGFDVALTADRLRDYLAVQNTYISTFQTLGGLGLVLGAIGLIAVILRNVFERRAELALLQALGFRRATIGRIVFAENATLVAAGLGVGLIPAAVVIAPLVLTGVAVLPWGSLAVTVAGVVLIGLGAGYATTRWALRARLIPALRSE
jgi:ABC-type antimicrobial peptide transport system permease subunit